MPKKILQLFTLFLFVFNFISSSTLASGSTYTENLNIVIEDPYSCGGNITGLVIGGRPPIEVTIDFIQNEEVIKTYTFQNLSAGDDYTIERPDKDIEEGEYLIIFSGIDSEGNTHSDSYRAEILHPDNCPLITTVRTGATKLIRENTLPVFFGFMALTSTAFFLIKNKKIIVER